MMTRNIDTAVPSNGTMSCQPTPLGSPNDGSPLGTGPNTETPCDWRSAAQLTVIAPTTATSPPGTTLIHFPKTTIVAITDSETSRVVTEVSGISFTVFPNLTSVPLTWSTSTFGDGTPSRPAS